MGDVYPETGSLHILRPWACWRLFLLFFYLISFSPTVKRACICSKCLFFRLMTSERSTEEGNDDEQSKELLRLDVISVIRTKKSREHTTMTRSHTHTHLLLRRWPV